MKGLYFYKLVSPYKEDVTKDCKLTINEIDHNFVTLKDADIKNISFDKDNKMISLVRNNDEEMRIDLSSMVEGITTDLKVDYDSVDGVITIEYNGEKVAITGLVTKDNLSSEVLTEVTSDGTLTGLGSKYVPLGVAAVEKTGSFKPAFKLIDRTIGEPMPCDCHMIKGDRYLTLEEVSDFGYLYDFISVKRINEDLKNGWRVPTKEDWDNMLNAVEPCDEYRNHNSALANNMLGRVAGKYLKSKEHWITYDDCCGQHNKPNDGNCHCQDYDPCNRHNSCDYEEEIIDTEEFDDFIIYDNSPRKHPNHCRISPNGIDSYGMGLVPAGFSDGCEIVDYFSKRGFYWTSSVINETDVYIKRFDFNKAGVVQNVESPRNLFSLRLVKDYDGHNHLQTEYINGMNYNTVLMPALNTKHGHSVWTAENIAFPNEKYHPFLPNNGEGLSCKKVYFINEWNGFEWERKQLHEGDSIVLLKGLDGRKNIEYRIVDGVLVNVVEIIYDAVMEDLWKEIHRIDSIIGSGFTDDNGDRITITEIIGSGFTDADGDRITITDKVKDIDSIVGTGFTDESGEKITITDKLAQEIVDRTEADKKLREDLDKETADRIEADKKLREDLEEEIRQREEADTLLQEELDRVEEGVGLDEDGNYIPTDGNYTSDAATVVEAVDVLDKALKVEETDRIAQDDKIEASVGLDEDGNYIPTDGNYTYGATTIARAIDDLDIALKIEETDREYQDDTIEASVGLSENGKYIPTDGKFTSASTSVMEAVDALDDALKAESEKREKLQKEVDDIETSVGLDEDGKYIPTDGKFTSTSTSVMEAVDALDDALTIEEADRIAQDDKIEASVGLDEDGNYIPTDGNYTSDASSVVEAVDALDKALKVEETDRIEKDEYLFSRLVKEGNQPNKAPEVSFDCAHGVLTLFTEDPKHNVKIMLNGDYGILPFNEGGN